jgi:hypothetical protein
LAAGHPTLRLEVLEVFFQVGDAADADLPKALLFVLPATTVTVLIFGENNGVGELVATPLIPIDSPRLSLVRLPAIFVALAHYSSLLKMNIAPFPPDPYRVLIT